MKTMRMQFAETLNAPDAPLLLRVAKLVWDHLPLFLGADLALCIAAVPAVAVWMLGLSVVAPWVAALTLGPVWMATSAVAQSLVTGESVTWRSWFKALKVHWRAAVSLSAVPALVATIFIGTWQILVADPHLTWLYLPLFVDGCVATFVLLACLSAFSLTVSRGLRGWTLWKVSLAVTTLRPGKMVGIMVLFLGLGLLLTICNAGLLPLLFAPLAVALAALTNQTCAKPGRS
jgi:uncharacterized membrane protein YesL